MYRFLSVIAVLVMSCGFSFGADAGKMQSLRKDFAVIAYGFAIDQICDITPNSDKVSYLSEYIDARWWLWRARTGVGKTISKKMAEKAWVSTQAGKKCSDKALIEITASLSMLKDFPDRAQALFGAPSQSLLNPTPNQKLIFAHYQSARLGWIIAKKCAPNTKMPAVLYARLMDARTLLLKTFRPNQLAGLEKATAEMQVWGTMGRCTAKRVEFANMAKIFLAELDVAAQVKKSEEPTTRTIENNQNS